jgi:hypothetical protein
MAACLRADDPPKRPHGGWHVWDEEMPKTQTTASN